MAFYIISLFALCTAPSMAQAYIDPATGSLIFQAVAAFIASFAVVTKLYYHKIKAFFSSSKNKQDGDATQD